MDSECNPPVVREGVAHGEDVLLRRGRRGRSGRDQHPLGTGCQRREVDTCGIEVRLSDGDGVERRIDPARPVVAEGQEGVRQARLETRVAGCGAVVVGGMRRPDPAVLQLGDHDATTAQHADEVRFEAVCSGLHVDDLRLHPIEDALEVLTDVHRAPGAPEQEPDRLLRPGRIDPDLQAVDDGSRQVADGVLSRLRRRRQQIGELGAHDRVLEAVGLRERRTERRVTGVRRILEHDGPVPERLDVRLGEPVAEAAARRAHVGRAAQHEQMVGRPAQAA